MVALVKSTLPDVTLVAREMTHRVSNEFASAISLVSLEAMRSGDRQVQAALSSVRQILERYAHVHRALQMPDVGTTIDVADYLSHLCKAVSRSKLESRKIRIVIGAQPVKLTSERCWMLGMIVNELITNAARHAFRGNGGTIRVGLVEKKGVALCTVSDNGKHCGPAVPQNGLKIVRSLAESLNGNFAQRYGSEGSATVITFPVCSVDG
jgi:two-component sensor histidine kinase